MSKSESRHFCSRISILLLLHFFIHHKYTPNGAGGSVSAGSETSFDGKVSPVSGGREKKSLIVSCHRYSLGPAAGTPGPRYAIKLAFLSRFVNKGKHKCSLAVHQALWKGRAGVGSILSGGWGGKDISVLLGGVDKLFYQTVV